MKNDNSNLNIKIEQKISLAVILSFIANYWKIVFGFMIMGFGVACIFILLVPKQYEVNARVVLNDQILTNYPEEKTSRITSLLLKNKMSDISFYDQETINECELRKNNYLVDNIKISIPNGLDNILDIKIRKDSFNSAEKCIILILRGTKLKISKIVSMHTNNLNEKSRLEKNYLNELKKIKSRIEILNKEDFNSYLQIEKEIIGIDRNIKNLNAVILEYEKFDESINTFFVVNEKPTNSRKNILIFISVTVGLILGTLISIRHSRLQNN